MVPWHVVHGMNGAIMVLPKEGLRDPAGNPIRYDRAYYIGEQDYYLPRDEEGNFIRFDSSGASIIQDLEAMATLSPTHIVFNGAKGSLQGDGALTANVGENVLIVHAQSNRQSYPHLIGGHGDYVWERGGFNDPPKLDLETWDDCGRFCRGIDPHDSAAWGLRVPFAQPYRGIRVRRQGNPGRRG